jgi:hypothetical protein
MFFFFDVRVNAILGGTSVRVINTESVYYLTWHGEKNRGTEFKPRVDFDFLDVSSGVFLADTVVSKKDQNVAVIESCNTEKWIMK